MWGSHVRCCGETKKHTNRKRGRENTNKQNLNGRKAILLCLQSTHMHTVQAAKGSIYQGRTSIQLCSQWVDINDLLVRILGVSNCPAVVLGLTLRCMSQAGSDTISDALLPIVTVALSSSTEREGGCW